MNRQTKPLDLFISYSHIDENIYIDENIIDEFINCMKPLEKSGKIKFVIDRNVSLGENFREENGKNLEESDIICLFLSNNALESQECIKEADTAIALEKRKGISVVPIILSECRWREKYPDLESKLAGPKDAKPVTKHEKRDEAWNYIKTKLENLVHQVNQIRQLRIKEKFLEETLQNAELLAKAHPKKEKVILDDIFVSPQLSQYDEGLMDFEKDINFDTLLDKLSEYPRILIAGEDLSGKTALCKRLFLRIKDNNMVPIYIHDKNKNLPGRIESRIKRAFEDQYDSAGVEFEQIKKAHIVPIIDDFHLVKEKENHIRDLSEYSHITLIADDIFSLNLKNEAIVQSFSHFRIEQYKSSLRDQLIRKWANLNDSEGYDENEFYKKIDKTTEFVESSLGIDVDKVMGKGIMPAYPFFVLSIISTYEGYNRPLDESITSQGYCYQALIYLHLRKEQVKNDEIDTYINFLTVFAYHCFDRKKEQISKQDFLFFMKKYSKKYNLPIRQETLLDNLCKTPIILKDSLGNYSFQYQYLYYFFVGRYLSRNIDENRDTIDKIIANLHKNEYAYISIFIFHHSDDKDTLKKIVDTANCLFSQYENATLDKNELSFFDEKAKMIAEVSLLNRNAETIRDEKLKAQDENENFEQDDDEENDESEFAEIIRSIRTVEVMGRIIKNRAGSLTNDQLENIFRKAMNVHLRSLQSFFQIIKDENSQEDLVNYTLEKLENTKKNERHDKEALKEALRLIFWNFYFLFIIVFIRKVIHSLGSDKLINIVNKVCDEENTPASFIIKHGILMWYEKNLRVREMGQRIKKGDFSHIAEQILKREIVYHCSMHNIKYTERQKISSILEISHENLPAKAIITHGGGKQNENLHTKTRNSKRRRKKKKKTSRRKKASRR